MYISKVNIVYKEKLGSYSMKRLFKLDCDIFFRDFNSYLSLKAMKGGLKK